MTQQLTPPRLSSAGVATPTVSTAAHAFGAARTPRALLPEFVTDARQLIAWVEEGATSTRDLLTSLTGTFFVHQRTGLLPAPYVGEHSLTTLLDELQGFKWQPVFEGPHLVALTRGAEHLSLGPGGQLTAHGGEKADLHAVADTFFHQLDEIGSVCRVLDQRLLAFGFQPKVRREQMPRLPRQDYYILSSHMNETGSLGLDGMARAAAASSTLTFSSESDMVAKMRVGLALQPLAGVLFACSPFRDGGPSGDLSFRNRVWQHTDPTRCAYLEFVFSDGFGFDAYVNWALSVPLAFLTRGAHTLDVTGATFGDLMAGRVEQAPGLYATLRDWDDHLHTLTPLVRLTRRIDLHGADMGPPPMALALAALWTGLFADSLALDAAWQVVKGWTASDRIQMYTDGPKLGLQARVAGRALHAVAKDIVAIAGEGLKRRARPNLLSRDETPYLVPLHTLLERGLTQAEDLVRLYCDDWNGSVDPVFDVCGA